MPIVYLNPGETLKVRFNGDNEQPADGEFTIEYSEAGNEIKVSESAGLEGSVWGGANSVLYHERCELEDTKPEPAPPSEDPEELAHQAEERGEARIRNVELAKKLRRKMAKLVDKDVLDSMLPYGSKPGEKRGKATPKKQPKGKGNAKK